MALLRCYAAVAGVLTATLLAWPGDQQHWPLLLVTLSVPPAVVVALRRAPAGNRLPWWILLAGMIVYDVGNGLWVWQVTVAARPTGDGTNADVFLTAGSVLVLCAAITVVVLRGRRDVGGIIDSIITAVALTGLLWTTLLLPALTAQQVHTGRQMAVFLNVFVIAGTVGALIRVSLVSPSPRGPLWLLTAAVCAALAGNIIGAVAVDPATGVRANWTNMVYMTAYALLACAALHPSVATVTTPGDAPVDHLTTPRLTFLGVMLALAPLINGVRAVLGMPADGMVVAFSSISLIPLVMIRIARLSQARRAAEQALHRQATEDGLTGLPNRSAGLERLTTELASGPEHLAALFCDLDGFKPINDRFGHAAGDQLLVAVADRLRGCLRENDLVCRLGGDEFVIICRGADAVDTIGDRIRRMVAEPIHLGDDTVRIGISIGAARARSGDTTDDLVDRADLAMYEAKRTKSVGALSLATA